MGTNSTELEVAHSVLTFAVNLNDVKGTSKGTPDKVFPCSKKQNWLKTVKVQVKTMKGLVCVLSLLVPITCQHLIIE